MIKELLIEKFKGINKINIKDLNKINIFIGANNSKKTTILEAISLMNINNRKNLKTILLNKKYGKHQNTLDSFFYNLDLKNKPTINVKILNKDVAENRKLELFTIQKNTEVLNSDEEVFINNEEKNLKTVKNENIIISEYIFKINGKKDISAKIDEEKVILTKVKEPETDNIKYVPANRDVAFLIENIRELQISKKIDRIIEILKEYDSNLQKVYVDGDKIYVDIAGIDESLSISTMGEGFISILIITSCLISMEENNKAIILIDEIENGLYRTATKELIKFIIKLVEKKESNIQLFITTHSEEFLKEFYVLLPDEKNISNLYRLEKKEKDISIEFISEMDAKELLAEGWEIR